MWFCWSVFHSCYKITYIRQLETVQDLLGSWLLQFETMVSQLCCQCQVEPHVGKHDWWKTSTQLMVIEKWKKRKRLESQYPLGEHCLRLHFLSLKNHKFILLTFGAIHVLHYSSRGGHTIEEEEKSLSHHPAQWVRAFWMSFMTQSLCHGQKMHSFSAGKKRHTDCVQEK